MSIVTIDGKGRLIKKRLLMYGGLFVSRPIPYPCDAISISQESNIIEIATIVEEDTKSFVKVIKL